MSKLSINEMINLINEIKLSYRDYLEELRDETIKYDANIFETFSSELASLANEISEDKEELEESFQDNYQLNIYENSILVADFSFYAGNEDEVIEIYEEKYSKEYPIDKHSYSIDYIGRLQSDRGYEMEVDRQLYSK